MTGKIFALKCKVWEAFYARCDYVKKADGILRWLLKLLDAKPSPMEELYKELQVDDPASQEDILRELSPEEAALFFADFCAFQAASAKRREFAAQGYVRCLDAPGGLLLPMLDNSIGAMGKLLALTANMEFAHDERVRGQGRAVRVEIVDDALCFVTFQLPDEARVKEVIARAINAALQEIGGKEKRAPSASFSGDGFDLEQWTPDSKKFQ